MTGVTPFTKMFEWSSEAEKALALLKEEFFFELVLVVSDNDRLFLVDTDASDLALIGNLLENQTWK